MLNIYLINTIHEIDSKPNLLIDHFNIVKNNKTIIVLLIKNICLVYGDLEDEDSIILLENELVFSNFNKYNFAGNRFIIKKLLDNTNSKYCQVKHLLIYKCEKPNGSIYYDKNKIQLMDIYDLNILKEILSEFNSEFYNDLSEHQVPSLETLSTGISEGTYYKYTEDNEIKAIGYIKNIYGFPELSLVHTRKQYRNNRIGTYLSTFLTNKLLNYYEFVMLYTKGDNYPAQKIFESIGYSKTGEYAMFWKEE